MKNLSAIITLFVANLVSGVAQGFTMIAIPWYFARDLEMAKFGWIYILVNLVALFWVPIAGTFVDRFDRRKVFLALTLIVGSMVGIIALIGHQQMGLHWTAVALVFMLTFWNYNIHYPNLYAFIQEITEPRYYNRITSAMEIMGQVATMSAGAGSALLLEGTVDGKIMLFGAMVRSPIQFDPWTIYEIFTLDAATYFLSFLIILMIRYTPLTVRQSEVGKIIDRLKIGWSFLKSHTRILIFGIASHSIFVTVLLSGFYLFPLYVKNHLNESGDVYATLDIYYGLGAIFTAAVIHWLFKRISIPVAIGLLCILCAVLNTILGFSHSIVILFVVAFLTGLCNAGSRVLRVTYLFKHVPNQVFGRSNGIFTMINIGLRIIFLLIFSIPFFLYKNHVIWAFWIFAIFLLLSAVVLLKINFNPDQNQ